MKKILIVFTLIICLALFFKYKIDTKPEPNEFGKITKIEIYKSEIGTQVIIYRMSKFPKGQIQIMSLEQYLKLKKRGKI